MLTAISPARHVAAYKLPLRGSMPYGVRLCSPLATCGPRRCRITSAISLDRSPLSLQFLGQQGENVFVSTSTDPYLNLAFEDHLLTYSNPASRTLFFYRNRPCVVIGRNQNPWVECDLRRLKQGLEGNLAKHKKALAGIQLVRRRSGGGTVFHDLGNLNYAVIVPNDSTFSRAQYPNLVVRALKDMDVRLDVKVNERNDIVIQRDGRWLKVSGSAYKLTRGRALAHGTLLFASRYLDTISSLLHSPGKVHIKAKGVESVRSPVGNIWTVPQESKGLDILAERVMTSIRRAWTLESPSEKPKTFWPRLGWSDVLPEILKGRAELQTQEWRFGQTPGFEVLIDGADGGGVELTFTVKNGLINSIRARHSSMEDDHPAQAVLQNHVTSKLHGMNLSDIKSWKSQLTRDSDGNIFGMPQDLIEKLSVVFPKNTGWPMHSQLDGLWQSKGVLQTGPVFEVETQSTNTVRQIKSSV